MAVINNNTSAPESGPLKSDRVAGVYDLGNRNGLNG